MLTSRFTYFDRLSNGEAEYPEREYAEASRFAFIVFSPAVCRALVLPIYVYIQYIYMYIYIYTLATNRQTNKQR